MGRCALSLGTQEHTWTGLAGRAYLDPWLPSNVASLGRSIRRSLSFTPKKVKKMREAWIVKLYLQRAGIFLTGPLHLPGLVLHSAKEVAEPGRLQILPGALDPGSQQLGGLLPGSSPPFLLFPRLQIMSPGKGISAFCPLGSSWEG